MDKIKVGIDIGSSKTIIVMGELYNSGQDIRILGENIIPSNGVKNGEITDIGLFSRVLKLGKEKLEFSTGIKIDSVTLGISGSYLKSNTTEIEYNLGEKSIEITKEHCSKILELSKEKMVGENEEVLTKEIYNFRVDNSGIMKNPLGKIGNTLKASVHIVRIPKTIVKNIVSTFNKANIEINNLVYSGEAAAKATLNKTDKINGVALVDIGYGLTEITIFKNDKLINTKVIPLGGAYYLNDLIYMLKLDTNVVKNILFQLKSKNVNDKITVNYFEEGKNKSEDFEVKYLKEIIDARTDEILEFISKVIEASGYKDYLTNGIVLTGGVVGEYEILEKSRKLLGDNIRIGATIDITGMSATLKKPSCASGIGVLLTALDPEKDMILESETYDNEKHTKKTDENNHKSVEKKVPNSMPKRPSKFKKWLKNFI